METGQMDLQPVVIGHFPQRRAVMRNRPRFTTVDIYDFLMDPDGGIYAQLTERTLGQMLREQQSSLEAALQDPSKKPLYDQQALMQLVRRISDSVPPTANTKPEEVVIRLAEVWNE